MHISNNMVSHIIDIANFLTQLFFCDFQPLPHIFAPPLFSLWCVTKLPVPWFVIWLLFIIIKTLKSEILHYWGRIFETLGQATPSHPTPLTPQKKLQILFDIRIAKKLSRIITEGIVKYQKYIFHN